MKHMQLPDLQLTSARQYNYYTIPKLLVSSPVFSELNLTAKFIYAMMLNRASLSAGHPDKFTDKDGRFYIIYTVEQLMNELQLSKPTVVKMIQQLCDIGLIEKKRTGQGKPSRIYLKDFTAVALQNLSNPDPGPQPSIEEETAPELQLPAENASNLNPLDSSKSKNSLPQEVNPANEFQKSTFFTSESKVFKPLEVKNFECRKNDRKRPTEEKDLPSFPPLPQKGAFDNLGGTEGGTLLPSWLKLCTQHELEENIADQIDLPALSAEYGEDEARGVVRLLADALSRRGPVKLGSYSYPEAIVKSRLLSLTFEHVSHSLDKLYQQKDVRNPSAYLLSLLFNAPTGVTLEISSRAAKELNGGT